MTYKTKDQAIKEWVPAKAKIIKRREDFIVYAWKGKLHILAIFLLGQGTSNEAWHVSMDAMLGLEDLTKILEAS